MTGKWTVTTSSGRKYLANFVFSASGALHIPNDTRFKDDEKFQGAKFHTALWDKSVSLKAKKAFFLIFIPVKSKSISLGHSRLRSFLIKCQAPETKTTQG